MIKISYVDNKGKKHTTSYTAQEIYNIRVRSYLSSLESLGFYSIAESIECGYTTEEDFSSYRDDLHTCRKNNTYDEFSTYDYRQSLRVLKRLENILEEGY